MAVSKYSLIVENAANKNSKACLVKGARDTCYGQPTGWFVGDTYILSLIVQNGLLNFRRNKGTKVISTNLMKSDENIFQ